MAEQRRRAERSTRTAIRRRRPRSARADALDHHQVAVRHPGPDRARPHRRHDPVPIGELARRRDIPVQFLEQLFAVLRRAGILRSQRGVKGGYAFARDPSEVTVLEVVELLDGPVGGGAESIFADAAAAARAVLAKATITDVVERENRDAGALDVPHLGPGSRRAEFGSHADRAGW